MSINQEINFDRIIQIAQAAGSAILEVYHNADFSSVVDYKSDHSPLTLGDRASHEVIVRHLKDLNYPIPIISEEGDQVPYQVRKNYSSFWLIDPLDGTKEFIKRNGEFTVNIALIVNRQPVFGVVHVPVTGVTYYALPNNGAYKKQGDQPLQPLKVNQRAANRVAVRSKSHAADEEEAILKQYQANESISVGSSLKFCMVAEGKADIYYRHGPTMEWDTAAGQAVVEGAGGKVLSGTGPHPFLYNKESLLNGSFLCLGF